MGSTNDTGKQALNNDQQEQLLKPTIPYILSKFKLYGTRSNFYMVGRDKSWEYWRVLKIDRSESAELHLTEDPAIYTHNEIRVLLDCINEGNKRTGGLKFVTTCYGIVGFIKFLGPYYMLLITKRRKIGKICGHSIYTVSQSEMIPIPHSTVQSYMDNSKNENRYKKLFRTVDITKDFFFSYSYAIMQSLQKNLCENGMGISTYDTMFCWNSFLTRNIRSNLRNTLWTVALVHGFFRQVKHSQFGRIFCITLIGRRSRHYAGTRYLKRGLNKKGQAANDVETEQIVYEENLCEIASGITSVVQNRASIPLFWSQETSRINMKPDILLSDEDPDYEATKLHFQNLVARYGNPIIIFDLVKKKEKKPRESILHAEYLNAVISVNKHLTKETRLKYQSLDLSRLSQHKGEKVLKALNTVVSYAFEQTGLFHCVVQPSMEAGPGEPSFPSCFEEQRLQCGALRTNCIDCLDRTNLAQYAYGLVTLGQQLYALEITDTAEVDIHDPLARKLMGLYEEMGDTLALQYGGSAAHSRIFSDIRGQPRAAIQSLDLFKSVQRYFSNAYTDAEKQDAINLFLGQFQPEAGRPALWELGSEEISKLRLRRSLSDGSIVLESGSGNSHYGDPLPFHTEADSTGFSESHPIIPAPDEYISLSSPVASPSYCRFYVTMSTARLFAQMREYQCPGDEGSPHHQQYEAFYANSDIIDYDFISSSGNSYEEDAYDRSSLFGSPARSSFGNFFNNTTTERTEQYPDSFVRWVENGAFFVS